MTTQRLSPAMRNALFAICHGGLRNHSVLPTATQQTLTALQQRGLIDLQGNPTEAGRAVFAPLSLPPKAAAATRDNARPVNVVFLSGAVDAIPIENDRRFFPVYADELRREIKQYITPQDAAPC